MICATDPRPGVVEAVARMAQIGRMAAGRHVPLVTAFLRHGADQCQPRPNGCTERAAAFQPADHLGDLRALVAEEGPAPQRCRVSYAGGGSTSTRHHRRACSSQSVLNLYWM